MLVAITGSSGYIGTALTARLEAAGHSVVRVRRGQPNDPNAMWDPGSNWVRPGALDGVEAVVHLGGVSIAAKRWTKGRKEQLRASRVDSTALLARHVASLPHRPRILVVASGAGYYGDTGEEIATETAAQGDGFLAKLVADWEAAAAPARAAGTRVVHARLGPLIGPKSELLQRLLLPFRLGLGGPIGNGRQWFSWVSTDDAIRAIEFALHNDGVTGPLNVVSPGAVRNRDFTSALGRELHRPAVIPVPAFALSLLFGTELVSEALLASQRVVPTVLTSAGFSFSHPTVEAALATAFDTRAVNRLSEGMAR